MSLLEQDTTRKGQINELFLEPEPEFDVGNNKKYIVEEIKDSTIYTKKAKKHLPGLCYLISWKIPREKKHLRTIFYNHTSSENNLHVL